MSDLTIGTELVPMSPTVGKSIVPIPKNTSTTLVFGTDRSILVDSTAANVEHQLPDPTLNPGAVFEMVRTNDAGNYVRFDAGTNTINGATLFTLFGKGDSVKIISDGTSDWKILNVHINGIGVVDASSSYTVGLNIGAVDVTTAAAAIPINFPPLDESRGRIIILSKADAGAGTVVASPNGADLINGSVNDVLTAQYESKTYLGHESEWRII